MRRRSPPAGELAASRNRRGLLQRAGNHDPRNLEGAAAVRQQSLRPPTPYRPGRSGWERAIWRRRTDLPAWRSRYRQRPRPKRACWRRAGLGARHRRATVAASPVRCCCCCNRVAPIFRAASVLAPDAAVRRPRRNDHRHRLRPPDAELALAYAGGAAAQEGARPAAGIPARPQHGQLVPDHPPLGAGARRWWAPQHLQRGECDAPPASDMEAPVRFTGEQWARA